MRRLKTVRRPPIYPNEPSHLPCSSLTHPAAVLTPSIGVLRWIRVNTAAVLDPSLISRGAEKFGSQCIVVAIDAERVPKSDPPRWELRTYTGANGGRATGIDAIEWAIRATQLGSGELVVNSIDSDGTGLGYDLDLLSAISASVNVPVIASGGVGTLQHVVDGLTIGKADAVLAASVFHYRQLSISQVKSYLSTRGIRVRPV